MTEKEKEQAEIIRSMINKDIDYIQKYNLKDLKIIFSFISNIKYRLNKKIDNEKIKKIIREDRNLAEEFIKEFNINLDYRFIANILKIDEIKAYAKIYHNSFDFKEIEKIAIDSNNFDYFFYKKTGKELSQIEI